MNPTQAESATGLPSSSPVPLESVLRTEELNRRPSRPPDYQTENRALSALVQALADSPKTILQKMAEIMLETFRADSAGFSLLTREDGGKHFYWPAIAGVWKPHIGGGTPRDFGPCGDVLDRNAPLLFTHFERRYPYFLPVTPAVEECLLVPFYVEGKAVGTIWAIAHNERRKFDAEDLRQLVSLGRFAASAYQAEASLGASSDSRRAALNLMGDAVQARQALEKLNVALRESEKRYRTLTSVITDVTWTTDPQGAFVTEQPAWTQYTGQTPEESRGFGWSNALHPDDREQVTATWERACETLSLYESRGRLWHAPTKQYRYFVARATPIINDDGSAREWVGSCTDVHERTLAEQERLRMLKFDETIMLGMGEGLYTVDAQGLVTSINPAAEKLFGWKRGELLGRNMHEVTHYQHRDGSPFPADQCAGLQVLLDGVVLADHEDAFIRRDGTFFDVTYSSSPLREGDQIVGVVVVFRDTSQRIAMEKEIREQAGQLADESRRKDEFLAMLSHELRNPLAPIRSAVHLLRLQGRGSENHIQQEAREIIERQVGNLTKLVSDLLEVSRVVSGRIRLDQQTVDINQVVRHATETIKPLIEQRKHELVLNLRDGPVWANVDATRMEEVFVNLLNNAAKYTEEGGRIEVHIEHPEEANTAQVRVRDNGVGIDKEILPRIFDLFTQADRSLARSAGGLGIGLSLARRLVDLHGGTLEAHSPPRDAPNERGSEFIVRLPLTHAPQMLQPVEPDAETAQQDGRRVLVVDDNVDQVTMLSNALRYKGYSVQSAYAGLDGLKVALQWRPDIVLLDIGLPGLDGYEIARRLRSDPATKTARLIALTGYARDTDITQAREAGFDAHLAKPLDFGDLEKLMALDTLEETTRD